MIAGTVLLIAALARPGLSAGRPNILFIITDQQSAGRLRHSEKDRKAGDTQPVPRYSTSRTTSVRLLPVHGVYGTVPVSPTW